MADNKEAIALFEELKDMLPMDSNGSIDGPKLRELLANNDSPAAKYLCSKIPEFFLRGCGIMNPYYYTFSDPDKDSGIPFDEEFINKIKKGDFSDIDDFEKLYPAIHELASILKDKVFGLTKEINEAIWKEDRLHLIKEGDDYLRCRKAIKDLMQYDGLIDYNGVYIDEMGIQGEIENHPEDQRFLEFAQKACKIYKMSKSDKIFRPFNPEDLRKEKGYQEEKKRELDELNNKLTEIENKIAKYNFITSIFKKQEKAEDLKKRDELLKEIESKQHNYDYCGNWIKEKEEEQEYSNMYKEAYFAKIHEQFIPFLKEEISKKLQPEQRGKVDELLNNIEKRFFSKTVERSIEMNPLAFIGEQLKGFESESFDVYMKKFYNALTTIAEMPNSFLEFEKSEIKDLFTLLKIIRSDMKKVPTDSDHEELKDEYRKSNLHNSISNFMDNTVNYQEIEPALAELNVDFHELLKEENTDEYIKKVGQIWYRYMLIHPYTDGNGRVGRYIINILLAHKNIINSSLYYSLRDQTNFHDMMDEFVVKHARAADFEKVGEIFLQRIKETGYDLTTRKPLGNNQEINLAEEEINESYGM